MERNTRIARLGSTYHGLELSVSLSLSLKAGLLDPRMVVEEPCEGDGRTQQSETSAGQMWRVRIRVKVFVEVLATFESWEEVWLGEGTFLD